MNKVITTKTLFWIGWVFMPFGAAIIATCGGDASFIAVGVLSILVSGAIIITAWCLENIENRVNKIDREKR